MDYRKLDASLAMAVDAQDRAPQDRDMLVLVRLTQPPSSAQLEQLSSRGVDSPAVPGRTVLTGMLSREDVETLCDQPWVLSLALSATRSPT
ncbi:hypothetical protein [Streptomyces sp. R33]|uniref:Uncharacterized protein n=1 Tax=Streptomyces sp. R33 TaxID=3238629 RepID=A0AB39YFI1_9ACTN